MASANMRKRMATDSLNGYASDSINSSTEIESDYESTDNDSITHQNHQYSSGKTIPNVEHIKSSITRRPTRLPNPSVSNRNALLARENRKRKKEEKEKLEKEVNELKIKNRLLSKKLKFSSIKINQLKFDREYLRNVIKNKNELAWVIQSLSNSKKRSINENATSIFQPSLIESNNILSSSGSGLDDISTFDLEIAQFPMSSCYENDKINTLSTEVNFKSDVVMEHNYSEKESIDDERSNTSSGLCVHINSGRISLEFCSLCYRNARNQERIIEI